MIVLDAEAWQAIQNHARKTYPEECCGILLGQQGVAGERVVMQARSASNCHPGDRSSRFAIHPSEVADAQRQARAAGLRILGFYHSHPDREVYFSSTDEAYAWPGTSHIVVSVQAGHIAGAGAFRAAEEGSRAVPEALLLPLGDSAAAGD